MNRCIQFARTFPQLDDMYTKVSQRDKISWRWITTELLPEKCIASNTFSLHHYINYITYIRAWGGMSVFPLALQQPTVVRVYSPHVNVINVINVRFLEKGVGM